MPLYDIYCETCEQAYEILASTTEMINKCPECGSEKVERQVCAPNFQTKGDGFYGTGSVTTERKK